MGGVSSKQSNVFFGSNWNKMKLNLFRLFFSLFQETKKHFFRFVSVFRTGIETTKTNRILSKLTKKISTKHSLLGGPQNRKFFFLGSNQNKPKLNLFWLFFGLLYREINKFFFGFFQFVLMFRTGIETTETNRTYDMGNKKVWYFNKFAAVSVGLLFVLVVSKHRNSLFQY